MKTAFQTMAQLAGVVLLLVVFSMPLTAQDLEEPPGDIPFIDRDGDGVNDIAQNGWGLRFVKRQEKRQLVWDQLNIEVIRTKEGLMADTDGDGVGDVGLREFVQSKHDQLIDTDGDGVPDTAIKDYLKNPKGKGLGFGDGNPDQPRGPRWRGGKGQGNGMGGGGNQNP